MGVKSIIDVKCDDKNDRPALGAGSDDDDRTCKERTRNHRANRVKWKESRECKKSSQQKEEEVRNDRPTRHSKKIQIIYYN